ncbi:hypothetical protein SteCoe_15939 [Stentor coeruleus]|uniref:Uncharacterized protein n=1 Tax=Stentor coeruleus TaxID=5963 RepID=A0A1R2BUB3_9CILI|nr:hypothetical protein SteCoe_19392 [Stentor coeruleus]OMJ83161.1 hypothetical protein SteCoe_15939 [Stentor coeruleus]
MAISFDGDGLLDIIYQYIWTKTPQDTGVRGFSIPDTIIYKYQQPRSWYFTSLDGSIKKRAKDKLKIQHIEKSFLKNVSRSGIVAWYLYIEAKTRIVEFLNTDDFKHFLHYRKKAEEGILQKFIDPKGEKNTLIQMIWTPQVCLFELRENLKDLYDVRYDIYERAVTFEGEEFHSTSRQICSKELKSYMQTIINKLVEHINRVSLGRMPINRMVLHFKQSKNDTLWLIRSCSIRRSNDMISEPIVINSDIHLPETVNTKKFSLTPQSAMALQKTVLCRNCSQPMEADKMCEISYRMILSVNRNSEMPDLIQRIHTQMNQAEYEKLKHNPLFLSKQTLVCDVCFLEYASECKNSGAMPRPQSNENFRMLPLDPSKTNKRRDLTNMSIGDRVSTAKSTKGFTCFKNSSLPRISTAIQVSSQKSLARVFGMNDITAFLEERYANRRLITR